MSVNRYGLLMLALIASTVRAENIVVLLPQSGPAAKAGHAVQDGMLAAYYQTGEARNASLALRFHDTSPGIDMGTLLGNAVRSDTRIVIGPLLRDQVSALLAAPPPVPVLALNRHAGPPTAGVWEFAMTPEEEITPMSVLMQQEGIQRVRILMQADEASQRIRQSFEMAWEALGGQIIPPFVLQENEQGGISASLRQMLSDPSSTKAQAFFLASPSLALQVQPLLAYYQRKPLPVYTISSGFDELSPQLQRRDLNGLRLCAPPWIAHDLWPERMLLSASANPETGIYNRLQAFGADAWSLQSLLPPRKPMDLSLRTGRLRLEQQGLQRTPECMEILDGAPHPLNLSVRTSR